jgi:methyl coenzyme M reductase subunit D
MKKIFYMLIALSVLLAACGSAPTPVPTATETPVTPTPTPLPTATATATLVPTPIYPPEGYGPSNFPSDVDPLTGLQVANPSLLERRPLLIKVSNLSRNVRPQWGLSLADIVFEYYTEQGSTRFAALFYGNDAETVGPIRSARFVDSHLVRGYKAVFAFGSAYDKVIDRLYSAEYANRLVIEGPTAPLKRFDPNGYNHLIVNTADLSTYITAQGVENGRQNLDGMFFQLAAPAGGESGKQMIVRYSASIYNRWDYDLTTGKYLRFSDTVDDYNVNNEQYAQLTDRLTNQPIASDNVVVLFVTHEYYNVNPEVIDIQFLGSGAAYAFRDSQSYLINWQRNSDGIVTLTNPDGSLFPLKPGTTWFEVVGLNSTIQQTDLGWRFTHRMP